MNGKSTESLRAVLHGHGFPVTKHPICADYVFVPLLFA